MASGILETPMNFVLDRKGYKENHHKKSDSDQKQRRQSITIPSI